MDDSHKREFGELLITLGATLGVKPDKPQLRGYWMALDDLSIEQMRAAVAMTAKDTKATYGQLPLPAVLRSYVCEDQGRRAELAWQAVLRAMARHGTSTGVDFDDRRTNAALRAIGGWKELGACHPDQLDWRRREFEATYAEMATRPLDENSAASLPGHTAGVVAITTGLQGVEGPRALSATSDGVEALVAGLAQSLTPPSAAGGEG